MHLHGTMLLDLARKFNCLWLAIPLLHLLNPICTHRFPISPSLPYETRHRINRKPLNIRGPILQTRSPNTPSEKPCLSPTPWDSLLFQLALTPTLSSCCLFLALGSLGPRTDFAASRAWRWKRGREDTRARKWRRRGKEKDL